SFSSTTLSPPTPILFPYTTLFRSEPMSESEIAPALAAVDSRVDAALAELKTIDPSTLSDFRGVGRSKLPSTVIGCLVHGAEHARSEEHTSELQSLTNLVCRLLLET